MIFPKKPIKRIPFGGKVKPPVKREPVYLKRRNKSLETPVQPAVMLDPRRQIELTLEMRLEILEKRLTTQYTSGRLPELTYQFLMKKIDEIRLEK